MGDKITVEEYGLAIKKAYFVADLTWQALGLCAEAGEVGNLIKKMRYTIVDRDKISDELGDTLWHWMQCCMLLGFNPSTIMKNSIEKTKKSKEK